MRIRTQIIVIGLLRVILNTMHRMVYPFLTVFARGLGVDVTAISFALAGRNLIGILGPAIMPVAERRGQKFVMLAGVVCFTLGVGLVAIHPSLVTFSAALMLAILSKSLFDPAVQAYFGDRVPYAQRGTAIAMIEMAWSLSFIAGVPAMGFLIAHFGWTSPFPVLAALGLVMFITIYRMIPRAGPADPVGSLAGPGMPQWTGLRAVLTSIPALAGVSIALWAATANESVNLVFGVWLEDSFGLQIAALAGASAVIGVAELGGESLAALITDRLGKGRAVFLGLLVNTLAALLLPLIGRTEAGALTGLFLFYISFEYMVVSQLPLMTETVPQARATVMAVNLVGFGIGRSIGALSSTLIYAHYGFPAVTWVAAVFNMAAILALAEMQQRIRVVPRMLDWLRSLSAKGTKKYEGG
jgi:MFS transporter, DHA1 family, inner membrane transport protein